MVWRHKDIPDEIKRSFFFTEKRIKKLKWRFKILIFFTIFILLYLFHPFIFKQLGSFLIADNDDFEKVDAVFFEEEFASREGLDICNRLFNEGKCKEICLVKIKNDELIFSDEQMENFFKSITDSLYKNLPVNFINLDVEHPFTLNKSKEILTFLKARNIQSLAVLTNAFHSRRTRKVYEKILEPENIKLYILTYYTNYNKDNWWQNSEGFRTVIPEYLKYFYYLYKGYM